MKIIHRIYKDLACLALIITMPALLSCSINSGTIIKEASNFEELSDDEILVVGKIELIPKLMEDEQKFEHIGLDFSGIEEINRDRSILNLSNNISAKNSDNIQINPILGETFYFKIPRSLPYITSGSVLIDHRSNGMFLHILEYKSQVILPAKFKLEFNSDDKAIYIGRLRYTRDDFNSVTNVRLFDDFKETNKIFHSKFGSRHKLKKSMIKVLK